jgi:hypothetical protein
VRTARGRRTIEIQANAHALTARRLPTQPPWQRTSTAFTGTQVRTDRLREAVTCDDGWLFDRPFEINETRMRLKSSQIAQASLLEERSRWSEVWSGTGSNCRPSAFQDEG